MSLAVARRGRRSALLAGLVALQALCAAFFLADVLGDLGRETGDGSLAHNLLELAVVLALVAGTALGALELRRLLAVQSRIEESLRAASGAFGDLLEESFMHWGLTPAEHDVALMAIKGLSTAEIAAIRGAAEGTVKAQMSRIYGKAGVSGRAQLLSHFIEELLADPLTPPRG